MFLQCIWDQRVCISHAVDNTELQTKTLIHVGPHTDCIRGIYNMYIECTCV